MEYKTTVVENPEKFEIKDHPIIKKNLSKIQGWRWLKTQIWGGHRWDGYKLYSEEEDPIKLLKSCFPDVINKKRKIANVSKDIEQLDWLPLDRLYTKINYGYNIYGTKVKENNELSLKSNKELFLKLNKHKPIDFYIWCLWAKDFENIKTLDDIIGPNYWNLVNKFINFCRNDMTWSELNLEFKAKTKLIKNHKIVETDILTADFYKFVTHEEVVKNSTRVSLNKLFHFIDGSDFLKGLVPGMKFTPSFASYLKYLDKIFKGEYSNNYKTSGYIKRLKENEVVIFNEDNNTFIIRDDLFIPNEIIKICSLDDNIWKPIETRTSPVTKKELKSTLEKLSNNPKFKIRTKIKKKLDDFEAKTKAVLEIEKNIKKIVKKKKIGSTLKNEDI